METNKYYVPELTEFHVGFEYEFNHKDKGWITFKFGDTDDWSILEIDTEIENNEIRVKYLDQEDIESLLIPLGYKEELERWSTQTLYKYIKGSIWNKGITVSLFKNQELKITKYHFESENSHNNSTILFWGTIKNKQELIKLMKQLGINE